MFGFILRFLPHIAIGVVSVLMGAFISNTWNDFWTQRDQIKTLERVVAAKDSQLQEWQEEVDRQEARLNEIKDIESKLRDELNKDRAWAGRREKQHREKEETIENLKANLNQCRINTSSLLK